MASARPNFGFAHASFAANTTSWVLLKQPYKQELADRVTLLPGRTQVAFGYKLTVALVPSGFTITADPQVVGRTGADSFFRDSAGRIRFEPELGKSATERSRLFSR